MSHLSLSSSLLCGAFYNLWKYEIERIELGEGGWQSRITGELNEEAIAAIKNHANVKDAIVTIKNHANGKDAAVGIKGDGDIEEVAAIKEYASAEEAAVRDEGEAETTVELYFKDMRKVFADTLQIAEAIGIPPEQVSYHYGLLAMYLIRSSQDPAPRLIFPLFLVITGIAVLSLIIIIHNSFAVSMNARLHQFGIFSSIGATPKQIRTCLLQEAAALCAVPVFAGNLFGVLISWGLINLTNVLLGTDVPGRHEAVFGYHPLVFGLTLLLTVITIWISAWLPARKLSRLTPLEAIKNTGELQLKRKKRSPALALLFGIEGELAGNALKAQRKALRTATLSLVSSFLAFTLMQCFFTLSGISTRETYFERYQNVWDIMITVRDAEVDAFGETGKFQKLPGADNVVVYQKAMAKRIVTEEELSKEMRSFGGFSHASGSNVTPTEGGWLVNAPVVILDDASFLAYCEQIGISPQLDGAVIRNQIRDVTNPDFRHPTLMPYVKGEAETSVLRQSGKEELTAEIPVLAYTEEVPVLREEYATLDYYEMVHFLPSSLWREIKGQVGGCGEELYIRILGAEGAALAELTALQEEAVQIVSPNYTVESENRIQEYETNEKQIQGMLAILGGFCVLLAVIGAGNVFSNTLGFVRQRKREVARYMSVGMTPAEIRKMFCIEALVLAGRPVFITLPVAVLAVWYMLKASYMEAGSFLAEAPFLPIAAFLLAIVGTVALAYYLGWRNVRKINLAEVLRDDTMM